jgi:predicted dehydrogenase
MHNRRQILQASGAAAFWGVSAIPRTALAKSTQQLRIGFVGCGGRAQSLVKEFAGHCTNAWACDIDAQRLEAFQKRAECEKTTSDLRQLLDDPSLDAVVISTPDHWHAPAAIMAANAGKHVYVEKPCSHNLREGRMLVDAARRNHVVVQHGTQSRNDPLVTDAIAMLRDGVIGEPLVAKAWNVQRRNNIGHSQTSDPPAHVDYDTWVGPAEWMPFQANRFHYDWHWWHNFGTGDIGNDGTHEIDVARWGLGTRGLPTTAMGIGGKYYFDDDQQFPDTATCSFEWPGNVASDAPKQLIFEMRIWSTSYPHNCDTGIEFYGKQGMLFVSKRGKLQVWDDANKPIKDARPQNKPKLPASHQVDFLEAIVEGRPPAAEIAIGHDSAALVHLANAAVRVKRTLTIDPNSETIVGDAEANALLGRRYRADGHWSVPTVS